MLSRADLIALYIVSGGFGIYTLWHVALYYWDCFAGWLALATEHDEPTEHLDNTKDIL